MNKKKWALVLLAAMLVFGYIKLFYKTYSEKVVAQNADCIIILDVKRITNTLIWNYITTPGQWKTGKLFSKKGDEVSWKDMFDLPDYIMAFHANNQPANAWYLLLNIKDKTDFEKGLQQFQFEKINEHEHISKIYGIRFFTDGDKVLLANAAVEDTAYLADVADQLFNKKAYIASEALTKAIKAKSHLAVYIYPNSFLQKEAVISANFNKREIKLSGTFIPAKQYYFSEASFQYNSESLCTSGFTQPPPGAYALLNKNFKEKISTALNINIDSVLKPDNKLYSLNLATIRQRTDSAISYTYDDEFNKVEKVVVNDIQEPAFDFMITGDNVSAIYDYLFRNNKLEKTTAGDLFTPMPLVKSYCSIKNENQLNIAAAGFGSTAEDKSIKAIFFLNMALSKVPANLQKYLPDDIAKALSNIAAIKLSATKNNDEVVLSAVFEKMKNDLPVIKF